MIAGTFLGGNISVNGDFAVVDDQKILKILIERCKRQGVLFTENCDLLNLKWEAHRIEAYTTQAPFAARVIIDAGGGASKIASSFRLHRIDGFYAVYGCQLNNIKLHSNDIVLGYVAHLGDPPPILEVVPTGESSAYCVIFIFSETLLAPSVLADAFEKHCRYNQFFSTTDVTVRGLEKAGAIPIGHASHRRLPGVVSLGEAALIQPPLMGTAFNEILEHTQSSCHQISEALNRGDAIIQLNGPLYPLLKRTQDRLQLFVARSLMTGNVELFDKTLRAVSAFSDEVVFNFFSNELTWMQLAHMGVKLPYKLAAMQFNRQL
jgi:2-polyprenyl-6-methoxyphenol hydroxylase-like FAD-dependent oxidoreductase